MSSADHRSETSETTTPRVKSLWRWLLLAYYLLIVAGMIFFVGLSDTPLPLALAAALGGQVAWRAWTVAREECSPARRALAMVGLALGIAAIFSPLLVTMLGWKRGPLVLYGWERRFRYSITPGWCYAGFLLFTSFGYSTETAPGSWLVKALQAARRYPLHLACAAAAGFALWLSAALTSQVSRTVSTPVGDVALALVAVQIGIGIHGMIVYPRRHQNEGPRSGVPAPWMAAAGWGWILGMALAFLVDYGFALAVGTALLAGR